MSKGINNKNVNFGYYNETAYAIRAKVYDFFTNFPFEYFELLNILNQYKQV